MVRLVLGLQKYTEAVLAVPTVRDSQFLMGFFSTSGQVGLSRLPGTWYVVLKWVLHNFSSLESLPSSPNYSHPYRLGQAWYRSQRPTLLLLCLILKLRELFGFSSLGLHPVSSFAPTAHLQQNVSATPYCNSDSEGERRWHIPQDCFPEKLPFHLALENKHIVPWWDHWGKFEEHPFFWTLCMCVHMCRGRGREAGIGERKCECHQK